MTTSAISVIVGCVANDAPQAGRIDYSKLSPAAGECLGQVALRLTAGSIEEVAEHFERERPPLRHLQLPTNKPVTKNWVSARLRELRTELRGAVIPD